MALLHRESVVTAWPAGQDPASWLATHGPDGLTAITRRGCLENTTGELRPRHCGAVLTEAAIDQFPDNPAERSAALHQLTAEVGNISRYLGPNGSDRYSTTAANVLAPVAVNIAIDAATNGDTTTIIEHVATYGTRLPPAGRAAYTRRAAETIEAHQLGAAEQVERHLWMAVERRAGTGTGLGRGPVDNTAAPITRTDFSGHDLR
jgi:hypothetical protein